MPHKRAKRSVREQNRSSNGADLAPGSQSRNALSNEAIPKSAARVLNAMKVQEDYRKRKSEDDGTQGKPKKRQKKDGEGGGKAKGKGATNLKILPGESLAHFNRRVEESLRPLLRDAMQTSAAVARKVMKEEELEREVKRKGRAASAPDATSKKTAKGKGRADDSEESEDEAKPPESSKSTKTVMSSTDKVRPTEFATYSASAPRRLNDIAEAPPELKKLPRGAKPRKPAEAGHTNSGSLREGLLSMAQKAMLEEERERVIKAYREMKQGRVGPV